MKGESIFLKCAAILLFLFVHIYASGQVEAKYHAEGKPFWVQLLYSDHPNPDEVIRAYENYFKDHPFVKNSDTQYYKRWLRRFGRVLIAEDATTEERKRLKREQNRFLRRKKAIEQRSPGSQWESIGPIDWDHDAADRSYAPGACHVYTVEQSPTNSDVLYAGTATAGVWKSVDRGLNWTSASKDYITGDVTSIEIAINDENTVYAEMSGGIWKTTDGGNTWNETGDAAFQNINRDIKDIVSHPTQSDILFVATNKGLYKTTNGGTPGMKR